MIADRDMDIAARLGRSDSRSLESLQTHNEKVNMGEASAFELVDVPETWAARLVAKILEKAQKRYGQCVALVLRDASPIGWEFVPGQIAAACGDALKNFDRGVWVVRENELTEIKPNADDGI